MTPFTSWSQVDDTLRGWAGAAWELLIVAGILLAFFSLSGTLSFAAYASMQTAAFLFMLGPAGLLGWRARRLLAARAS